MLVPSEAQLLALWEQGQRRHPVDRALLLCAWARPELPGDRLAELPLGALNAALLRMREACFGPRIDAYVDCPRCGERLGLPLDAGDLLAGGAETDLRADLELAGLRFRVPCSRDLAAVAGMAKGTALEAEAAAHRLLELCCLEARPAPSGQLVELLAEVETGLAALDPAADISLALACEACGHRWAADFDIGALLWEEIEARARALLAEIHGLARAYGWTEPEILALSPERRAAYLELAGA
ncbi:MAG TPA: hypothetical protein VN710_10390 [Verrucomicrobiae bacterium]|jgi:hypothetical protein|nr:hypothetical protein [Verrucomicrobiae bacterium]